jgi:hypothetical protein
VLPSGVLPVYHPFCCVILLWLVITLWLFVHVRVECLMIFEMADIHEQCINITFFLKLGKTFMGTHEMIKNVYSDQCMSCTRCYELYKWFKDGQQSTHDQLILGQPSVSCAQCSCCTSSWNHGSNCCLTVWEIAEECNISIGSCHDILTTKLEMHREILKFVPRLLTQYQRQLCCHLSGTFGSR